ncbi:MAG TPA: hypothetical protein VHE30_02570 [Polyangiaceae bacterium]|nr:hypothetical protein [Polyangiaceae bacterium]
MLRVPVRALVSVFTLALLTKPDASYAESDVRTPSAATAPCAEVSPGARLHDGFFARSDTGIAVLFAQVSGRGPRSGIRAVGQSATISVGGTPARGLVIGGMVWTARLDPVFIEAGRTIHPDDDSVKITMLRLGPFLDYYPDPRLGLHFQTALQFSVQIESDVKGNAIDPPAVGAATSVGVGYEWFLSSEASLGFLARTALGDVVRTPVGGEEHQLWVVPELGVTATYQ